MYYTCLPIIMIILCHFLETTLYPEPPTLEVCPHENYTLSCIERGTARILWNWNDIILRD